MPDVLHVSNLSKSFGKLCAVDDVSFSVAEGEVFGIAGPNGAGKTTLFNAISGVPYHPDAGEVEFLGKRIDGLPGHAICHLGLARTFQRESIFDSLNVLENVVIGSVFGHGRRDKSAFRQRAIDALELVGYHGSVLGDARSLSLFDKKRLMLASALATEPRLLLLDEPAAGLNQMEVDETAELIRRINSSGMAVVLIEHVLPLLLSVSQRIMILNQGALLTVGVPDEVVKDEHVIEAYLGKRGLHDATAA
jgi:branched-chain amino acid transport system ATP-binding protein